MVFILAFFSTNMAVHAQSENGDSDFERAVSAIVSEYDGLPYKYGGDPQKDGATDNSHLFHSIIKRAAGQAGLGDFGYMTISGLLENVREVNVRELKNGDFIVIRDRGKKYAALVYDYRDPKNYRIVYASESRQKVSSFHSSDKNFQEYWLENIVGFYRLNKGLFKTAE